ncbi:MAG: hypothetical protein WC969_01935 [Elusimicrobiota bacterium]|jgi:hypothetical protein
MKILLAALLFALSPAPLRAESTAAPVPPPVAAEAADFKGVLAEALLAGRELPPAPAESAALRARAAELALGRPEGKTPAVFEGEVRALARDLGLDATRTTRLVKLLGARARSAVPARKADASGADARALKPEQGLKLQLSAQLNAQALGLSQGESLPGGQPAASPSRGALAGQPLPPALAQPIPPDPSQPGLRLKAAPMPQQPPQTKPLSWEEVERVVDVGEKPKGWLDRIQYELAPYVASFDRPEWKEQRTTRKALELMQTTPEGREVLRQLVDELGPRGTRKGVKIEVRAEDFGERSSISMRDGVEGILGARGRARYTLALDKADYHYSSKYLEFKDQDMAVTMLAGNMAHEFRHLVNVAQLKRLSPEEAIPYQLAFVNEQRARQTGYLVAARLNKGKSNDYLNEANALNQDPDAFWDDIKRSPSYIRTLDPAEMKEPLAAYKSRLEALREDNQETRENISRSLPRALDALSILAKKEGRGKDVAELQMQAAAMLRSYPEFLKGGEEQEQLIGMLVAQLETPKGKEWATMLAKAGDSAAFQGYSADYERDRQTLAKVLKATPAPKRERPAGSLTWEQFWAAVKESRAKHPAYWVEFEKKYGKD